ncbi:BLOC-3 complex member HPS1-like [Tubulanus polymorphus]|uniref:BLOC-3 complex member HPS1-like n=1 Tax=Tubulanus polymorphus TaxID=672921 RepID=UPI003DA547E4
MKGVFMFNSLNDVAFQWADDQLRVYLVKQAQDAGLMDQNEETCDQQISSDVAMQLFSPLIASQRFMINQTRNPYSSIICENGHIFVLKQFHDYIQIAICGDCEEDEEFLHKKLLIFQKMINFLYGPVIDEIRQNSVENRIEHWQTIGNLLQTWTSLYQQEQSFLVEAIERLHVSPVLNVTCIELLETTLMKMKSAGDKHALHSLLLVNSKLLGLYSSRNAYELQPSDLLFIILITRLRFQNGNTLEELMWPSGGGKENRSYFSTLMRGEDLSESEDEYWSVNTDEENTTGTSGTASSERSEELLDRDEFFTPEIIESTESKFAASSSSFITAMTADDVIDGLLQMTVFLHTPLSQYTPHLLYCLQISPGVILVIISEIVRGRQAGNICQVIELITNLLSDNAEKVNYGRFTYELLENGIRRILDACRKIKSSSIERNGADIRKKWEDVKQNNLLTWLEMTKKTPLESRLENSLSRLRDTMKTLFKRLYISRRHLPDDVQTRINETFVSLRQMISNKLSDFSGFLAVKSQRNITMTFYLEDFPGLVHFLYINRTHDHLTAPSINIMSDSDQRKQGDATQFLKKQIWSMVRWSQEKLKQGHVAMSKREGDFVFSYFLWFEDQSGNPLPINHPYKYSSKLGEPGIITDNFYKKLIRHCFSGIPQRSVRCYEIYVIHIGLVPADVILTHCLQLSGSLWESSGGDMDSTFNLL